VKKYVKASDGLYQQSTGDSVTGGTAESEVPALHLRPTRERRTPEYLNDYELYCHYGEHFELLSTLMNSVET